MYADVTVIVDGAVEEEERFTDEAMMRDYIAGIEEEQVGHGYPVEVYVIEHDHAPAECECHQYVQDGRPRFTFPDPRNFDMHGDYSPPCPECGARASQLQHEVTCPIRHAAQDEYDRRNRNR